MAGIQITAAGARHDSRRPSSAWRGIRARWRISVSQSKGRCTRAVPAPAGRRRHAYVDWMSGWPRQRREPGDQLLYIVISSVSGFRHAIPPMLAVWETCQRHSHAGFANRRAGRPVAKHTAGRCHDPDRFTLVLTQISIFNEAVTGFDLGFFVLRCSRRRYQPGCRDAVGKAAPLTRFTPVCDGSAARHAELSSFTVLGTILMITAALDAYNHWSRAGNEDKTRASVVRPGPPIIGAQITAAIAAGGTRMAVTVAASLRSLGGAGAAGSLPGESRLPRLRDTRRSPAA